MQGGKCILSSRAAPEPASPGNSRSGILQTSHVPIWRSTDPDQSVKALFNHLFCPSQRLLMPPDVPLERLETAKKSYLFLQDNEELLGIFDESLFKTGSDGYALTTKRLYWKHIWEEPQSAVYSLLRPNFRVTGVLSKRIYFGDGKRIDVGLTGQYAPKIVDFLTEVTTRLTNLTP